MLKVPCPTDNARCEFWPQAQELVLFLHFRVVNLPWLIVPEPTQTPSACLGHLQKGFCEVVRWVLGIDLPTTDAVLP